MNLIEILKSIGAVILIVIILYVMNRLNPPKKKGKENDSKL